MDDEGWQSSGSGLRPAIRSRRTFALAATRDLLFPPICACCEESMASVALCPICDNCRRRLIRENRPRCSRCCRAIPMFAEACSQCNSEGRSSISAAVCIGSYERDLRDAVLRSKLAREFPLATAMADLLVELRGANLRAFRLDAVVAMPMHWIRRFVRGVNGPQLVAERLASRLELADLSRALRRGRNTPPQASLPPSARLANVRGAFRARGLRALAGKRFLLVDDVMTTGATCREAAATLLRAGAGAVYVAVIARSDG